MTDSFSQSPVEPMPTRQEPEQEPATTGMSATRIVLIASGVLIGILIVIFIISLLIAQGDVDRWGGIVELVRDFVIIFLALEGILIILALAVLILQVARLINLLQNEVRPVLKNTQDTLQSAKGTVDFVGDTVAGPVIRASAFMAGASAFIRNAGGIRRATRRRVQRTS